MRIADVMGKLTLSRRLAEVPPGNLLLARVCNRRTLAGSGRGNTDETIVVYDILAAREGDRIGLVEGREAAVPFSPASVPFDAYNACILDRVEFDPIL